MWVLQGIKRNSLAESSDDWQAQARFLDGELRADIGLLDVRFRGKTLRVKTGELRSFQWGKGEGQRDTITSGDPTAFDDGSPC